MARNCFFYLAILFYSPSMNALEHGNMRNPFPLGKDEQVIETSHDSSEKSLLPQEGVFQNKTLIKQEQELDECLKNCWGIDHHSSAYILYKFKPLLENSKYHSVIKDFIALSKKQNINFSIDKKIQPLPSEDGIYQSPKEHVVLFENPYLRILWSTTEPGAREPLHVHAWKSVVVVIKPTTYEIEWKNGLKETATYDIGAFELPAGEHYACTNLGKFADECLRFEVKD